MVKDDDEDANQASPPAVRPHGRPDDANAFVPDPAEAPPKEPKERAKRRREQEGEESDDLAEVLAEEYVASATTGEPVEEDVRDALVPEELGGPFVEETADAELVDDDDPSNPPGTEPEPFPTAVRVPPGR